jgi:hypothetical protein
MTTTIQSRSVNSYTAAVDVYGMRICTSIVTSMDEEGNGDGQH